MRAINPFAGLILSILLIFTLAQGANSAASAAFMSTALLLALACLLLLGRARLGRVFAANWISLLALAAFLAWSALALWPAMNLRLPGETVAIHLGAPFRALSGYRGIEGIAALLGPVAACALGALLSAEREARDWVGRSVVGFALLYAAIALGLWSVDLGQRNGRLDVAISSANAAAALFGVLSLFCAASLVRAARKPSSQKPTGLPSRLRGLAFMFKAPISLVALIASIACLLLTGSRGGLAASSIALLIFALAIAVQFIRHDEVRRGAFFAPVFAVIALFAFLIWRGGGFVFDRFVFIPEDLATRRTIVESHWRYVEANPWTGQGLNSFHELNYLAMTPQNWPALSTPGAAHNIYVQVLEETGIVGLALLALALAPFLVRAAISVVQKRSGAEWSAALLAAWVLILTHGLVDFAIQVPAIACVALFLTGAFAGSQSVRR